eukprot:366367-Chlamydomonas_euryale.AAC.11
MRNPHHAMLHELAIQRCSLARSRPECRQLPLRTSAVHAPMLPELQPAHAHKPTTGLPAACLPCVGAQQVPPHTPVRVPPHKQVGVPQDLAQPRRHVGRARPSPRRRLDAPFEEVSDAVAVGSQLLVSDAPRRLQLDVRGRQRRRVLLPGLSQRGCDEASA